MVEKKPSLDDLDFDPDREFPVLRGMGANSLVAAGFWPVSLLMVMLADNLIRERELWVHVVSVLIPVAVVTFHLLVAREVVLLGRFCPSMKKAAFLAVFWQGVTITCGAVFCLFGVGLFVYGRRLEYFPQILVVVPTFAGLTLVALWRTVKAYEAVDRAMEKLPDWLLEPPTHRLSEFKDYVARSLQ